MKNLAVARHVFGMLLLVGIVLYPLIMVTADYPRCVLVSCSLLSVWLAIRILRVRRQHAEARFLAEEAFQSAYVGLLVPPSMDISFRYGYPAFQIQFRSEVDMENALPQNDTFKVIIDRLFKHCGSRSRPFHAETAISFTYDGFRRDSRVFRIRLLLRNYICRVYLSGAK